MDKLKKLTDSRIKTKAKEVNSLMYKYKVANGLCTTKLKKEKEVMSTTQFEHNHNIIGSTTHTPFENTSVWAVQPMPFTNTSTITALGS